MKKNVCISLTEEEYTWYQSRPHYFCLSKFVQQKIDEEMTKEATAVVAVKP